MQYKNKFENEWGGPNETFEQLMNSNTIPTPTIMLRKEIYNTYCSFVGLESAKWRMGDYPLWLYLAYKSKIKFSNEIWGTYRELSESASHSKSKIKECSFLISYYDIKLWYAQKVGFSHTNPDLCKRWEMIRQELKLRISIKQGDNQESKHNINELRILLNNYDGIIPRRFKLLKSHPYIGTKILEFIDFIKR